MITKSIVKFLDTENNERHMGILCSDSDTEDFIICLCCGGIITEDYEILEAYPISHIHYIEDHMKIDW